jgi:ATP phosphoribosyltransferase regulatory subunit
VGLAREVEVFGEPELLSVPRLRGGVEVLEAPETEPLRALHALLPPEVAERVIFDLGLTRPLSYYTGAVFEVYDAAVGAPLGGGGRYDDLLGRFGRELPACGWALDVERLHAARVGEGR